MKRISLMALCALATYLTYAQTSDRVKKNHSINFPMGIGYAYEQPISKRTVLNFEIILGGAFTSNSRTGTDWYITPIFHLEPRFYYNYFRRQEKNKSVTNNSASYFALSLSYQSPLSIGKDIEPNQAVNLVPKWGVKIPLGDKFTFNIAGGIGIVKQQNVELTGTYEIDLNFGYNF